MEVLLYFLAGIVLASIGAYFVLRSIKSSAANALTKALEDAAKIAAAEKDAAVAQLKADLNNANENLQKAEDDLKDAKTDVQESVIKAKSEAEERYIKQLDEYKNAQKEANEKLEALHNQALKTMKEQLETKTRDMFKERQDEFAKTSKEKLESLLNPFKTDLENMKKSVENNQGNNDVVNESLQSSSQDEKIELVYEGDAYSDEDVVRALISEIPRRFEKGTILYLQDGSDDDRIYLSLTPNAEDYDFMFRTWDIGDDDTGTRLKIEWSYESADWTEGTGADYERSGVTYIKYDE